MIHKRIIALFVVIAFTASFMSVPRGSTTTVRAAVTWTLATTVSPVLLYEASAGAQPLVLYLQDNNGAPVDTTGVADITWSYGSPVTFTESAPPQQISNGYWLLAGTPVTGTADVRFSASGTVGGVALASNSIIISVRTLGAFNPQLLLMTHDSLLQNTAGYLLYGKHVFDRLPCTVGNSVEVLTVLYAPKNLAENYPGLVVKKATTEVRGNVTKGAAVEWPVENANVLPGVASGSKYFINEASAVSVQMNADIWWLLDATCATLDEGRNAQAGSYTKGFELQQTMTEKRIVLGTSLSKNADGTHNVQVAFAGSCPRPWEMALDVVALKADGSIDERFGAAGHVWFNGIPSSQRPEGTGISDLPGQGTTGDATSFGPSTVTWVSDCKSLTLKNVDLGDAFSLVWGETLAFWLYGNREIATGAGWTHPAEYVGTFAPYVETTINGTTAVKTLVAGVTQSVPISNAAFSVGIPSWTTALDGSAEGIPQYKPVAGSSGTWTVDMTPALPRAGTLRLTGVALNLADGKRETMTLSWSVVMPEFTVTLRLSDGTTIPNDHLLTEGIGEVIGVTAQNPATKTPIAIWWEHLSAQPNVGFGGAPTCVTSAYPQPSGVLLTAGIANPYFSEGTAKLSVYALLGGARVLVDTFTLTPPVLTITPSEVPYTIPARAARLVLHAVDAHAHPLTSASTRIVGEAPGTGKFTAGSAQTDTTGEAVWAIVPLYIGVYTASVEPRDVQWPVAGSECVFLSWKAARAVTTGVRITAKYEAPAVDTEKPVVTIADGTDRVMVTAPGFTLRGNVTDNVGVTQLFVGFDKVVVLADGSFTAPLTLVEGDNPITITAYDAAGNKGTASVVVTYVPATAPPALTLPTNGTTVGTSTVMLSWKAVSGATSCNVALDTSSGFTNPVTWTVTSTSQRTGALSPNTTYYWRVASVNAGGTSAWSTVFSFTTRKPQVTLTLTLQLGNTRMLVGGTDGTSDTVTLDAAPVLGAGNRTLVPVRAVAEAMGGTVGWDPVTRTASVMVGSSTLELTLGKNTALFNGTATPIDTDPKVLPLIVNGRTMLPLRFVVESLGAQVSYDQATKTITITYTKS